MFWLVTMGLAWAQTTGESETVAQVRHDLFGQGQVPLYQYIRMFGDYNNLSVTAYAGGEWADGVDQAANPEIYLLQAEGRQSWGRWSVGRQQALTVLRPQTFDGGLVSFEPSDGLEVNVWGGSARHHDLDDLTEGVGFGRAELRVRHAGTAIRTGVELTGGSELGFQEDFEAKARIVGGDLEPEVRGLLVLDGSALRWARVALSADAAAGVRATLHAQRRKTQDPEGLLGEAVVVVFAPLGVDELGLGVRAADRLWAALSASYVLARYDQGTELVYGHGLDVAYARGPRAPVEILPAYRFRSGPGGVFHAVYATARVHLGDVVDLGIRGAVVPYRKLHAPWATALALGLDGSRGFGPHVSLRLGVNFASDAVYAVDIRGGGTLLVRL